MSNRQDDALPELPEPWDPGVAFLTPEGVFEMPVFTADQMHDYAQSAIASLQARLDAAEKAVEFAEYMAKGGEQLMAAIKAEGALRLRRAESDDVADDDIYDAGVTVGEMLHGLECDIYEFRKRAARSAA